ncbi:Reverse transcriptase domain-containing protein [Aphis craccivora]|uniref:Reverse transcriptase domain-containing protein n=1 Tax=Aphis craccivora TaxID=307492 RepID=A0A6G0ZAY0_APHCR|nr:Reverse transcriptase domain-containing protein [Aphis craccivora]
MIRFADDIVVIAKGEGDIQRVVEEMDEMIRTTEMKINSTKTKILVCARDPKKRLIKTYVWSVATYGCETWVINNTEKKKLEAFEMCCWRRMKRISWIERKTNEEVHKTVGKKCTLIDVIRERRWKIVGHAMRHPVGIAKLNIRGYDRRKENCRTSPKLLYRTKLNVMQKLKPLRNSKKRRVIG